MGILFLIVPILFFALALKNKKQLKRLKFSGRIPEIHSTGRNYHLFLAMSVLTLFAAFFYLMQF